MKRILLLFFLISAVCVGAQSAVYDITRFGAVCDTTQLSTAAIQKAIDTCHEKGGGEVRVPAGDYKTGTLILKSNVNLHLELGATLYGSTLIDDYIPVKPQYLSLRTQTETIQLIYAENARNVAITGLGCIDGRGKTFPKLSWNDEGITRPHLLRMVTCSDVTVSGVTLRNSGCWMQHYLACDRVRISGIKVFNRNNYNNDALDLDGCHDVVVSDMMADSDDDGITLKSTSPRCCENITISNCVVSSHCNAVKLGTESNGGFRNITISHIVVKPSEDQTSQFFGNPRGTSAISLEIVDGGVLENVSVSDFVVEGTEAPVFVRLGHRARGYYQGQVISQVGSIRNVYIHDITVTKAGKTGCSISGIPGHPVENVYLSDIWIEHEGGVGDTAVPADEKVAEYPEATMWGILPAKGFFVRHARDVVFSNVHIHTLQPDSRPEYVSIDAE